MDKVVLITGATGALGSAVAREVAKNGATTIISGRNRQKLDALQKDLIQKSGNKSVEIIVADFTDPASIKNAAAEFKIKHAKLDVLLNVAAVYKSKREQNKNGLEMMFATNHLGPFVLTNELIEVLKASGNPRVINVTAPSTTKLDFDDLQATKKFSSLHAFGASKMSNLLFTYSLQRKYPEITSMAFFPGLMKSELMHEMKGPIKFLLRLISKAPEKAAHALVRLAFAPEYANARGKFYDFKEKELKSSDYSYDNTIQDKLWKTSEELSTKKQ